MNDAAQPTDGQRIALRRIKEMEDGENPWFKPADAEDCVDHGWAEKMPSGRYDYVLTDEGRALLKVLGEG